MNVVTSPAYQNNPAHHSPDAASNAMATAWKHNSGRYSDGLSGFEYFRMIR